jgi:hypothetical protein
MPFSSMQVLIGINAATFITILTFGYKIVRFINRIEFRTDLMWQDYKRRMNHGHPDDESDAI